MECSPINIPAEAYDETARVQFPSHHPPIPMNRFLRGDMLTSTMPNGVRNLQTPCDPTQHVIQMAVAIDTSFCSHYGNYADAIAAVTWMINIANLWYEKPEICMTITISHIEGYCSTETDPYQPILAFSSMDIGCTGNPSGLVYEFRDFWQTNRATVSRDTTHFFTMVDYDYGG